MEAAKHKLRAQGISDRWFWKASTQSQYLQIVEDQNADYGKRKLTQNEVSVMGLNEICAKRRRGFFFHMPSRQSWTVAPDEQRLPVTRRIVRLPTSEYPTVVCMDFVWAEEGYNAYLSTSQRARYLQSSAIINPPPGCTPMYPIQWAPYWKYPIYRTKVECLVVFQTPVCFYLLKLSDLADILGFAPGGLLVNTPPDLWTAGATGTATGVKRQRIDALAVFQLPDLDSVHSRILAMCRDTDLGLPSSYTASELSHVIPRASASPATGTPLGTGLSADPPSRKREVRKAKHRRSDTDDMELDAFQSATDLRTPKLSRKTGERHSSDIPSPHT